MKSLILVVTLLFMVSCAEDLGGGGSDTPLTYLTHLNVTVSRLTDANGNDRYYGTEQGLTEYERTLTSYFVSHHNRYVTGGGSAWVRVTRRTGFDPRFPVLSSNDSVNFNIYTITVTTGGRGLSNPNEPDWVGSMSVSIYDYNSMIRSVMLHMLSTALRHDPSYPYNTFLLFDSNGNLIFD